MNGPTWTSPLSRIGISWSKEIRDKCSITPAWLVGVPRQVLIALLVAGGYYLGSRIGFLLTPRDAPISMFWPPNAVLLAAFVLAPHRKWWIYLLAVLRDPGASRHTQQRQSPGGLLRSVGTRSPGGSGSGPMMQPGLMRGSMTPKFSLSSSV